MSKSSTATRDDERSEHDTDLTVCVVATEADKSVAPMMGYGACSISGCPCKGYQATYGSELCSNCGHKYTDHW